VRCERERGAPCAEGARGPVPRHSGSAARRLQHDAHARHRSRACSAQAQRRRRCRSSRRALSAQRSDAENASPRLGCSRRGRGAASHQNVQTPSFSACSWPSLGCSLEKERGGSGFMGRPLLGAAAREVRPAPPRRSADLGCTLCCSQRAPPQRFSLCGGCGNFVLCSSLPRGRLSAYLQRRVPCEPALAV
jgi:hypothetical protein